MSELLIHNFEFIEKDKFTITADNRAFLYGDGLFETIIYAQGLLRFFDDHWQRLTQGIHTLGMSLPGNFTSDKLQALIIELIGSNKLTTARIKIQVWRKPGGLYTPDSDAIDFMITAAATSAPAINVKNKAGFVHDLSLSYSHISSLKTLSALPYVYAAHYRKQQKLDEVIILGENLQLAEAGAANIFLFHGTEVLTPTLESGCIAGIMRKNLLHILPHHGYVVTSRVVSKEDLRHASHVITCNVAGVSFLKSIEQFNFETENPTLYHVLRDTLGLV